MSENESAQPDKQAQYELRRRNRRLGYAIDNILTGCKLLLAELNPDDFLPEHRTYVDLAKERITTVYIDSQQAEKYLLSIGSIYETLIPRERNIEQ